MKRTIENINHFESETFEEHADIFDAATNIPVYGQIYGIGRKIAGIGNDIFGKKEDKSDVGFKAYKNQAGQLPFYPTKEEMIKAATQGKWQAVEIPAITASYNPQTGTWKRGDWNFAVSSTSPIQVKFFKGAKESGGYSSSINAAVPYSPPSQNQNQPPTAVHVSDMPKGSTPIATQGNQGSNPNQVVATQPQTVQMNGQSQQVQPGDTVVHNNAGNAVAVKKKGSTKFSGAADLSAVAGNIPGGSTTMIIMGVVAVVVIILIIVSLKK